MKNERADKPRPQKLRSRSRVLQKAEPLQPWEHRGELGFIWTDRDEERIALARQQAAAFMRRFGKGRQPASAEEPEGILRKIYYENQ